MSETEKKGSPWPWILVPVAAIGLFFVLRQCRQSLPPHEQAVPEVAAPDATVSAVPTAPASADPQPAAEPAPQ